ncbi:hypothetical protein [uncultured Paracoccus sp.]|uniref:hypothetical protein n=1 Tax=uncultured Paracoccus sp. TaxID=189685 RepID=UPI0025DAEDC0|nr:hypothetical protein [uncultured Paracoccus sp.]
MTGHSRFGFLIADAPIRDMRIAGQASQHKGNDMHMAMVTFAGLLLLAVFALFGRLWGHDAAGIALALRWFIPVWAGVALVNMWVGVTKAGYSVAQELPILVVVFAVPAIVALFTAAQLKG